MERAPKVRQHVLIFTEFANNERERGGSGMGNVASDFEIIAL